MGQMGARRGWERALAGEGEPGAAGCECGGGKRVEARTSFDFKLLEHADKMGVGGEVEDLEAEVNRPWGRGVCGEGREGKRVAGWRGANGKGDSRWGTRIKIVHTYMHYL